MIWFSSDWHYNHRNICKGTSDWSDTQRCRDFDTLEQMNFTLVNNINKCVKEDDEIWFLGDFSFGGINSIWEFRKQIKCKNIHLVFGNHDQHIESFKSVPKEQFEEVCKFLNGEPKHLDPTLLWIRDIFSSVQYYKELSINKQKIILSHYAMRVWNKSHHGSWMLYGHSHGTLDQMTPEIANPTWIGDQYFIKNFKTMDVGIDTSPEFRPYSFTELKEIMDKKEVLLGVDHHSEQTN